MTMLSRVAERLYWMARYHERTENMARLTDAYTHLLMDLPEGSEMGWDMLINILDAQSSFEINNRAYSETNVLKFLISDEKNSSSLVSSISAMRENARTTRDAIPELAWEYTNELHQFAQDHADKSIGRRKRYQFLEQVLMSCQQLNGFLLTTLSRDHAYRFIKIGHLLERADMTTRIVDVGAAVILGREEENSAIDPLLWACLLKALASMSNYRQYVGPVVEPASVADLVFRELAHPRSVVFCLKGIREELVELQESKQVLEALDVVIAEVSRFSFKDKHLPKLHQLIQSVQARMFTLNNMMAERWFYYQ